LERSVKRVSHWAERTAQRDGISAGSKQKAASR